MIDRRVALAGGLCASMALAATFAHGAPTAQESGLDRPTRTWLRLVSDLSGQPTFAVERGDVWGFKPQADDLTTQDFAKRLYGYWSLVARQAAEKADGSVALKTKAWTFYLDPLSGEIVTHVVNPYTGMTVPCPPLSGPVFTADFGSPAGNSLPLDLRRRRLGECTWVEVDRISRFKPADTTWFKLEADLVSYACRTADLENLNVPFVPSSWSHNVVAEWQTWMKMHGAPGHILFKGDGSFIGNLDATPPELRLAIDRLFPSTLNAVKGWG